VPYLPGLDGLRAISVLAVLLYHDGVTGGLVDWMGGGFLGVEVFFVISGYLITLLLIGEHERTGLIDLRQFWLRRARRLLPALYTLLLVVTVYCILFYSEMLAKWRGDVVAALLYVTNWYLIWIDSSYFERLGRPSPFNHLWSLAVEEQFYLVWPLVVLGLLMAFRRRLGPVALTFVGIITASTVLMALWYDPVDPSRVYYGTITRAASLACGALLALFWRPSRIARAKANEHGRVLDLLGLAALAAIVLFFVTASETGPFLYRGGFLLVSVLTLVVIAAVTHPASFLASKLALGNKAFAYIGTRSYGLYLWHWPVFVFLWPGLDVEWTPGVTLAVRMGLVFALTELSYRFIEQPIRGGAIGRWSAATRAAEGEDRIQRNRQTILGATIGATLLGLIGLTLTAAKPVQDDIAASLEAGQAALIEVGAGTTVAPPATTVATPSTAVDEAVPVTPTTAVAAATTVARPAGPYDVVFIGDSVMLGAAPMLQQQFGANVLVDAAVNRNFRDATPIVQALKSQGKLGPAVVVHLGNNGGIDTKQFEKLMGELADVPLVLFVNLKLPRSWEAATNKALANEVPKYANARLLDWKALSSGQANLFYKDGMHLRPAGGTFYAEQLRAALA
jgi:peptidoglycan/LPS O-acetylase OafA/YrhL